MKGIVYTMILKLGQDKDICLVNTAFFIRLRVLPRQSAV